MNGMGFFFVFFFAFACQNSDLCVEFIIRKPPKNTHKTNLFK